MAADGEASERRGHGLDAHPHAGAGRRARQHVDGVLVCRCRRLGATLLENLSLGHTHASLNIRLPESSPSSVLRPAGRSVPSASPESRVRSASTRTVRSQTETLRLRSRATADRSLTARRPMLSPLSSRLQQPSRAPAHPRASTHTLVPRPTPSRLRAATSGAAAVTRRVTRPPLPTRAQSRRRSETRLGACGDAPRQRT